jgi:hypothetical protein
MTIGQCGRAVRVLSVRGAAGSTARQTAYCYLHAGTGRGATWGRPPGNPTHAAPRAALELNNPMRVGSLIRNATARVSNGEARRRSCYVAPNICSNAPLFRPAVESTCRSTLLRSRRRHSAALIDGGRVRILKGVPAPAEGAPALTMVDSKGAQRIMLSIAPGSDGRHCSLVRKAQLSPAAPAMKYRPHHG